MVEENSRRPLVAHYATLKAGGRMLEFARRIPIIGQYFDCRSQHYSASLLEFGFILLASLLPVLAVTIIEVATNTIDSFSGWSLRFAPELAIAASCIIAPMMYFFVTPSHPRQDGERTDFPHKGSLQLCCLTVFALGMILYVVLSCIKFFNPDSAQAVRQTLFGLGLWLYLPSLALSYTAILFRNFSERPPLNGPDNDVGDILADLEGRPQ